MSEKNKTKIEKKLLASIALVMIIGIATVVPLTFFMTTARAQTDESWFNIRMERAYFSAYIVNDAYQQIYVFEPEFLVNFDAFNQQKGARIEYFEIIYYTDDLQLLRTSCFIGGNSSYIENPQDFITLSREKWFNSDLRLDGGGNYYYDLFAFSNIKSMGTSGNAGSHYAEFDVKNPLDEKYSALLTAIEGKQTIYLDVIRAGYTTFDGDNIVINTTDNAVVIQRLELVKTGDAFMFGNVENIETWLSDMV